MNNISLKADISARFKPFLDKILEYHQILIDSVHIVGSALTRDFDPKRSDINSVIVLKKMDLKFLEFLAPLGKKFGRKRIAAPLIMTPAYINNSLDVFPIEFFDIQHSKGGFYVKRVENCTCSSGNHSGGAGYDRRQVDRWLQPGHYHGRKRQGQMGPG